MKRQLLTLMCMVFAIAMQAQTTPNITLKVGVDGKQRELSFVVATPNTKLNIDWGDGTPVETEVISNDNEYQKSTPVYGIPVGTGDIKIYGDEITYFYCGSKQADAKVTALDVSNAPKLKWLFAGTNSLTQLDVSHNPNLLTLAISNNQITDINLTNNTQLTFLEMISNQLSAIDLSHNRLLKKLQIQSNKLTSIDLSANTLLKSIYLMGNQLTAVTFGNITEKGVYISVSNNRLTSLDLTMVPGVSTGAVFAANNMLTEIKCGDVKNLNVSGNQLTFATLPTGIKVNTYNYAPQQNMRIQRDIELNEVLDLSSQTNLKGITNTPQTTKFTWKTATGETLTPGTDYTEDNGKFTFIKAQADSVYAVLSSPAFPKFVGTQVFKTTKLAVAITTGINDVTSSSVSITAGNGRLTVSGLSNGASAAVYDAAGNLIATRKADVSTVTFALPRGLYIVKAAELVQKVSL